MRFPRVVGDDTAVVEVELAYDERRPRFVGSLELRENRPRRAEPEADDVGARTQMLGDVVGYVAGALGVVGHDWHQHRVTDLATVHVQFVVADRGNERGRAQRFGVELEGLAKPRIGQRVLATFRRPNRFAGANPLRGPLRRPHRPRRRLTPHATGPHADLPSDTLAWLQRGAVVFDIDALVGRDLAAVPESFDDDLVGGLLLVTLSGNQLPTQPRLGHVDA